MTLPVYSRSYPMTDPPKMVKKAMQICEDLKRAPDTQNKMLLSA